MANPSNKYTDEYRREPADYIISTGRPAAEVARELGVNEKTAGRLNQIHVANPIRRGVMSRAVWRSVSAASAEVVPRCKKQQLAIFFGNVEAVLTA